MSFPNGWQRRSLEDFPRWAKVFFHTSRRAPAHTRMRSWRNGHHAAAGGRELPGGRRVRADQPGSPRQRRPDHLPPAASPGAVAGRPRRGGRPGGLEPSPGGSGRAASGIFDQNTPSLTLDGSACGILGFGGIGRATAGLMCPFGARIFAINTSGHTDEPVEFVGTRPTVPARRARVRRGPAGGLRIAALCRAWEEIACIRANTS